MFTLYFQIQIIAYSLISFFIFFLLSKISYRFKLTDLPNRRKIHSKATAYTGGMAISLSFVFSIFIFDHSTSTLNLILSMSFLICVVGLIDDKYDLSVGNKLILQMIPICYLIILENLTLSHIGDYYYFKLNLDTFAIPFTLLCVLFLINAFNYFDGIDGTLSFSSISVFAILSFLNQNHEFQLYLLIILIPICIFLFFNFSIFKLPKLFLGDGGSLLLGFLISFNLIYLAINNVIHPILIAWSISIFVYEFICINLIRLKNKQNLFKAGQDHMHHLIFIKTKSIFLTNFIISLSNIVLFLLGYLFFYKFSPLVSLILFIFLFIIFLIFRNKYAQSKLMINSTIKML